MTNRTRFIPTGYAEFKPELGDYPKNLCAVYVDLATKSAIFYKGKSNKHLWYNRFLTVDDMKEKIKKTISNLMEYEDRKRERREARKSPTTYKVGDIFYSSWGYDQTNVNFYEIVALKGKQTLELREVASKIVSSDGGPSTHVVALPGHFLNEKTLVKRASGKYIRLSGYETGFPWDGKPKYETASGWGH